MTYTGIPKIFLSYSHSDIKKAEKIESDLNDYNIEIIRDERSLQYTEDIPSYMNRIRSSDYAIILVSDAFLKSVNCMSEIYRFFKDDNHKERIFPVILDDYLESGKEHKGAKIYKEEDVTKYIRYWQGKENKARQNMEGIDYANLCHLSQELSLIQNVTKTVNDFIFLLMHMKHVSFNKLIEGNYKYILSKCGIDTISPIEMSRALNFFSQALSETSPEVRLHYLNKAIEINPNHVDALKKRGHTLDELKQYKKALEDYEKAISIDPEKAALYISRSYAFIRLKEYTKALNDLDKALSLAPYHEKAYVNRADTYRRMGKYDDARKDIEEALKINKESSLAFATLAEIDAACGDTEEFYVNIQKAVEFGFPLHKYCFDDIYNQFKKDGRFKTLFDSSTKKNEKFIF